MVSSLVAAVLASWSLDAGARIRAPAVPVASHVAPSVPVSIFDVQRAIGWSTEAGLKEEHLRRVYGHLFRHCGELTPAALHERAGLPQTAAVDFCKYFVTTKSRVLERIPSEGGMKLVVELASGHHVEMALILHEHKSSATKRCTVCVSSQVGCARACSFCETGTMGLRANLGSAEILEQVWHVGRLF